MAFVTSSLPISRSSFTASPATSARPALSPQAPALARRAALPAAAGAAGARASATAEDYEATNAEWVAANKSQVEVMEHALSSFPGEVAIAFSGAEDVVLIEYASRTRQPYRVFSLDTGRLHAETYRFYAEVEKHYGIRIEYTFPDSTEVTDLVNEKGLFSFYEDGHQECCRVRKVRPLRRKLGTLKAWITGQRKDQSPGTRAEIPLIQLDPAFKGVDDGPLIKYNPLASVSSSEVWATIRSTEVPYNALHNMGYISIGCEPCTRPVLPNQHEREGRWWWEEATQKECGLHKGNISTDAAAIELADEFVSDSIKENSVTVFTKEGCPYCKSLKDLLAGLGVPYTEFVISSMDNYGDVVASLERMTGQNTAPNVFINQQHIGGNEETQNLHKEGKLLPLVEEAAVKA